MAKFRFKYANGPEATPFHVPDERLLATLTPRRGDAQDEARLFREALDNPLGTPSLAESAAGARRVLIIVDDATRATPVARILPHVARELRRAGVSDDAVTVLTAQGTHRRMREDELARKIGREFLERWRVRQHDYQDQDALVRVGETREGMPVVVNRLLTEADVRIGIGQVGVHGIMGYSGGGKIVIPGIAGRDSERWTHWNAASYAQDALMGRFENPIRTVMERGVRLAGLDAVLNVVMDHEGTIQRALYGDFVDVHRHACETVCDLWAAPLAEPADVVLVEATPADRDYWQSVKGLYAGTIAVRNGGVIVLAAPNPEGVARNHPNVLELSHLSPDAIRDRVDRGLEQDVIGAAVAVLTAKIKQRSDVVLVSGGVDAEETRRLGFERATSMQAALDAAMEKTGGASSVAVVRNGGGILPLVTGRNAEAIRGERAAHARSKREMEGPP